MTNHRTLRLILGDQLNAAHSWYRQHDDNVVYVIAELRQETDYVRHHIQKVCAFFAGMNAFAQALTKAGHAVEYLTLDETQNDVDLASLINRLCSELGISQFEYQRPDEYRLMRQLRDMEIAGVTVSEVDTEHFYLNFDELGSYFKKDKAMRMESFYRKMRTRFNVLMNDGEPLGGRWNYDADNRSKLKKNDLAEIPAPLKFENDVSEILERVKRHKVKTIGKADNELLWPVTRAQAKQLLAFFCSELLPKFGTFQDAMTANSAHSWSLYHSRLSFALNAKLLSPHTVVDAAVAAYHAESEINLAQVEGFVRQILGWREFVRGMYWLNMPDYAARNTLNAKRALPDFFWTGDTKMRCLSQAITQTLDYSYAHHIQRLMITGNFCLLAGIDPAEVDAWYLGVYVDAIEWVEMPNTRGMSQFADGGMVASKPYAASGAYVNRMSDYCADCYYDVKQRSSEQACPLNSLYWHFMIQHEERFARNPRTSMAYRNWSKMSNQDQALVLERAQKSLSML